MTTSTIRKAVWAHYREHGRHALPWRKTHDPYKVLVSEVMLQQTQVDRVVPYFKAWMKEYPNVQALAAAPLARVLTSWQGLGYNRRAKMLHEAAKAVVRDHDAKMPKTVEGLESLPGVGPYTARAVAAFAYNQDIIFIETNIRTVIIHHVFGDRMGITDAEIYAVLEKLLPEAKKEGTVREWYAALMDYGSHLKRSGVKLNARSKGYAKQSKFEGSGRQVRGAILKALVSSPATQTTLEKLFDSKRKEDVRTQIAKLLAEALIEKSGRSYRLPT
jgi:A/G-specific adenine glycosylase